MTDITKALVLETFMKHYGGRPDPAERRRAMEAYNATIDDLALWKESRSEKETQDAELVIAFLTDILVEDFKIGRLKGRTFNPAELAGAEEGKKAAEVFLKDNGYRIPPLSETQETTREWLKTVRALAFDLAPKDHISDKEWTCGFVGGFTGGAWTHLQRLSGRIM